MKKFLPRTMAHDNFERLSHNVGLSYITDFMEKKYCWIIFCFFWIFSYIII